MKPANSSRLKRPVSIKTLLQRFRPRSNRFLTKEYQLYGLKLADELNDWKHKSLYIRLAKEVDRDLLEKARYFVRDAQKVKSRAKLFMWKLKQLRRQSKV